MVFLHSNFTVDSVRFNTQWVSPVIQDSCIKIKAPQPLSTGTAFTVTIYYKGTAPTGGAAIGSGYSLGNSPSWGNQVTWSLSESFVAYHWWPCKQDLYRVKFAVDEMLKNTGTFAGEAEWLEEQEKERMWKALNGTA